jgi:uncharacterized membrane protein YgcG
LISNPDFTNEDIKDSKIILWVAALSNLGNIDRSNNLLERWHRYSHSIQSNIWSNSTKVPTGPFFQMLQTMEYIQRTRSQDTNPSLDEQFQERQKRFKEKYASNALKYFKKCLEVFSPEFQQEIERIRTENTRQQNVERRNNDDNLDEMRHTIIDLQSQLAIAQSALRAHSVVAPQIQPIVTPQTQPNTTLQISNELELQNRESGFSGGRGGRSSRGGREGRGSRGGRGGR